MKNYKQYHWFVPESSKLIWKNWGNEFVVYNCNSGDTHLIDLLAAETLKAIEKKAITKGQLFAQLSTSFDTGTEDKLNTYIEGLLKEFHRLGLIERGLDDEPS